MSANLPNSLKYPFRLSIQEAADFLKVSTKTLRRWEKQGVLIPERTIGNQRRYSLVQLQNFKPQPRENLIRLTPIIPVSNLPFLNKIKPAFKTNVLPSKKNRSFNPLVSFSRKAALITFLFTGSILSAVATLTKFPLDPSALFSPRNFHYEPTTMNISLADVPKSVLAAQTVAGNLQLGVNIPANFSQNVNVEGNLTAPNIIYGLIAGPGITVSAGQTPTISATALGVNSFQGQSGDISLTADAGISITGTNIKNTDPGSAQEFFSKIKVTGQSDIDAGGNKATLEFAAGNGISLSTNSSNKQITIASTNTGIGITNFVIGDLLYASSSSQLATLAAGLDGQMLTLSGGIPTWTSTSTTCSGSCIGTSPIVTQIITPASSTATGLIIAQASGGTADIFSVTNNSGLTKFFFVDSIGNVNISSDLNLTSASPTVNITNGSTLAITDGTNTLATLDDNGTNGTLNIQNIAATNIGGFNLTGNIVGVGSPSLSGIATINGGTFLGGTFNGATISGGTLSGGTISGGTYTASGLAVTGNYTATIGDGNSFTVSDGSNSLLTLTDNGLTGSLSVNSLLVPGLSDGVAYITGGSGTFSSEPQLAITRGGTNSSSTPTAGAIAYGTGTAYNFTLAGIAGQFLQSNGAGTPTWVNIPTGGVNYWQLNSGALSPVSLTADVNLGATATASAKVSIAGSSIRGMSALIVNQTESQDIFTASSAGNTRFTISSGGDYSAIGNGTLAGTTGLTLTGAGAGMNFSGTGNHTISASTGTLIIGAFTASGNITGSGSPTISGFGTINGATISGGTLSGGTVSSGTLSGGTLSGGTYSNTGLTVTGSYAAQLGNGSTFSVNDGTNDLFTVIDNGTHGNLGIGTNLPLTLLHVSGAQIGKALAIFNETGDQNIFTASAGGATRLTLGQNGDLNLYPYGASAGNTAELRFRELIANGSNYVGLKSPDSITSSQIYVLPSAVGTNSQVLTLTNAATGTLEWADVGAPPGASLWQENSGVISPYSLTADVNLGSAATASAKISLAGSLIRGKAVAIFNQTESQDILTASSAGSTRFTLGNTGNITLTSGTANADNLRISPNSTGAGTFLGTLTSADLTGAQTWTLPNSTGTLALTSQIYWQLNNQQVSPSNTNFDLIVGGTATASAKFQAFGIETAANGIATLNSTVTTTGNVFNISGTALTTGNLLNLSSTSTALTSGRLASLDWSPSTPATASGDLFRLNIGASGDITGNLFNITSGGSSLFSLNETQFTTSLPSSFTAAGDVSIAYDQVFTNQTSSNIESYGPLSIKSGESFESNNLTLKTYNSGNIILDVTSGGIGIGASVTPTAMLHVNGTKVGKALAIFNETGANTVLTASVAGATKFYVSGTGITAINFNGTAAVNAVCHSGTDIDSATDSNRDLVACNPGTLTDYAEWYPTASDVDFGDVVVMGETEITVNAGDGYGLYEAGRDFAISKLEKSNSAYQKYVVGVVSKNFSELSSLGKNVVPTEHHPLPIALNGRVPVKVSTENGPIHAGDYLTSSSTPGVAMKATKPGFVLGKALSSYTQTEVGQVMVFVNNAWVDPNSYLAFDDTGKLSVNGLNSATDVTVSETELDPAISLATLNNQFAALDAQVASLSAQLASLNIASVSGTLTDISGISLDILGDATISGRLFVTAPAVLSDTTVTGTLRVGLLKFDDLAADLSSLSGLLSFQNGAAVLSDQGNLDITGKLTAKAVAAEQFQILGTATSSASIGKAVIPVGDTELTIDTTAAATSSAIFVTPDQPVSTAAFATDSGRFTIRIPAALPNDLNVNWWIIN